MLEEGEGENDTTGQKKIVIFLSWLLTLVREIKVELNCGNESKRRLYLGIKMLKFLESYRRKCYNEKNILKSERL